MCGRFTLNLSPVTLATYFHARSSVTLTPRYNIAPSQRVAVVRQREQQARELVLLRWGLVPPWQKETEINSQWINARMETADQKPLFRQAFRHRRCIIPASGFYEWQKTGKRKQPYYIYWQNNAPLAFAGLWEHWENTEGKIIESCTILTTDANALLQPIHARMPVMLAPAMFDVWLDPNCQDIALLKNLLNNKREIDLALHPVSLRVNNPMQDDEGCIAPAALS